MERRERTRQLIELGQLVQKAELGKAFNDDRAALYGAFLELSEIARSAEGADALAIWRQHGQRLEDVPGAADEVRE
jgi:hypothetical protein